MKVIIFIETFPYYSQTFIYNQFIELHKKGIDVRLVSLYQFNPMIKHGSISYILSTGRFFCFRHGIHFKLLVNFFIFFKKIVFLPVNLNLKEFFFIILNYDILYLINTSDIVHTHFGDVGEYVSRFYKYKIFDNVKLVNSFHGFDISPDKLAKYKLIYKNLIAYSKKTIVNSNYSYSLIKQIDEILVSKTKVIPYGVDVDFFYNSGQNKNSNFTLIFVGRLIKLKGVYLVVEIINKLKDLIPNLKLNMVGDGEEKESLSLYIKNLDLEKYIVLHGAKSMEEIKVLYSESDIFISPGITDTISGRAETQGIVIQEAQSMSLPVIVSDCGGMKYGLIDGVTGFVVVEGDIVSFCEKISLLYKNPSLRIRLGMAGRDFVRRRFNNSLLIDDLISTYRELN